MYNIHNIIYLNLIPNSLEFSVLHVPHTIVHIFVFSTYITLELHTLDLQLPLYLLEYFD